jgi:DNA-binding response OmpR family regulator
VLLFDRETIADADTLMLRTRRGWPTVIITVVNAAGDPDVSRLIDAGADDSVPASSPILASRLHAVTRRARTLNAGTRIAIGDILFDRKARWVWCGGRKVELIMMVRRGVLDVRYSIEIQIRLRSRCNALQTSLQCS